jgi:hypothetical protein
MTIVQSKCRCKFRINEGFFDCWLFLNFWAPVAYDVHLRACEKAADGQLLVFIFAADRRVLVLGCTEFTVAVPAVSAGLSRAAIYTPPFRR